jgi:CheY-like chemotaxis protein
MSDKVNILLVDDQPARLLSYRSILEDLKQNLVTANSGNEALSKVMKQDFAVILLDVSMPGMDGFETASLIHEHPRYERTPIIFVTGVHITELDRLKGYKLGAVDYVNVPVVPEILRSKVAVLVELYLKRRELQNLNRSLEEANQNLERANSTLQADKARELERLNRDLTRANAEFEAANRALASEVDERRRIEQALRAADRQKNEFIAILAHELRNPLAPIHNALQLMQRGTIDDAQVSSARDIIARQSKHLSRLVDDLLDVSRVTRGTVTLSMRRLELATVVARAVEATGRVHPAARVKPVVGDSKSMFAINRVQPSGRAPVHRLPGSSDKVDSREELLPTGRGLDAGKTTDGLLLMVVEDLTDPTDTAGQHQARCNCMGVSHEQPTAKPMVGGCVIQRIVYKTSGYLFLVAPIRSVNGLLGVDIVVEGKTPNRMRKEWNKSGLEIVECVRRCWFGNEPQQRLRNCAKAAPRDDIARKLFPGRCASLASGGHERRVSPPRDRHKYWNLAALTRHDQAAEIATRDCFGWNRYGRLR